MSLVNEYRNNMRTEMGLPVTEEDPMVTDVAPQMPMEGSGACAPAPAPAIDQATMQAVLEMIKSQIAQQEGAQAMSAPAPMEEVQADTENAKTIADDIYFEMLGEFKSKVAACEDPEKKKAYGKVYNFLYKMREKFIAEMTAGDEVK